MKRIAIILVLLICSATILAQNNSKPNHRVGLAVDGGWSHLFLGQNLSMSTNLSTPSWGWFGGGELVYEMEYKHLLARVALAADYSSNWNLFDAPSVSYGILEYPTLTYLYDFANFKQKTDYANLYIPLMVGAEFKSFYFLVGTKLGFCPFAASTLSYVDAHIHGIDEDVINPLEGLYTHDMGTFSYVGDKNGLTLNPFSASASFEVGLCIGKQSLEINPRASKAYQYRELHRKKSFAECTHLKLALFADYGLTDMYSYQPNAVSYPTESGFEREGGLIAITEDNQVKPNSMHGFEPNKDAILHNLFVGLRLAIMYQVPHQPPTTGSMANPHIVTVVSDGISGELLSGASVQICSINPKNNKPKYVRKTTGGKYVNVDCAFPPGKYDFNVTYPGYLPFDTIGFDHGENFDTLFVRLYQPLDMTVDVIDRVTGKSIASKVAIHDENGNSVNTLNLDSGMVDTMTLSTGLSYQFCATSPGYLDTCYVITREHNKLTIQMTPIPPKAPQKFVLKAMYFATDKTKVLPSSEKSLMDLYSFLSDFPEVKIRIIGHTDSVASDAYNQRLSEGRANSVMSEMVQRGIDASRMEPVGKGESEPIVPNDTDGNRQMNRRVEIEITSGDIKVELLRERF